MFAAATRPALLASLYSVEAGRAERLAVDDEGGTKVTNSPTRFIAPAVGTLALVGLSRSHLDYDTDGSGPETQYGGPRQRQRGRVRRREHHGARALVAGQPGGCDAGGARRRQNDVRWRDRQGQGGRVSGGHPDPGSAGAGPSGAEARTVGRAEPRSNEKP